MAKPTTTVFLVAAAVALVLNATVVISAEAPSSSSGGGGESCMMGLATCASALNGGKPSQECCKAMKTAVETQLPCLCRVLNNPQFLADFKLTPQAALLIPQRCGLNITATACSAASVPSSPSEAPAPTPAGSLSSPNGAGVKLPGSALAGIFLITISLMFY